MNKWSLTLLVILTAAIIATLILTSQLSFWSVSAPLLSVVLGWLLKTINDSVTISQQHQWEIEKISQERTLKYYEAKLSEMSSFIVDELVRLVATNWALDNGKKKIQDNNNKGKFTKEWMEWASSARTFAEVVGDEEIVSAYNKTAKQSSKWLGFVKDFNSGKFDTSNDEQIQLIVQNEIGLYMDELKGFQTAIERVRLKVLRGEIIIKK